MVKAERELSKFTNRFFDMLDELMVDEETGQAYDKNPYTPKHIKYALDKLLTFHTTKGIIESYYYDNIVSNPDFLSISVTLKFKGKDLSFDVYTKF